MPLTDILVGGGVILAFVYLILARLKEKNPKRHESIVGMFKNTGKLKEKLMNKEPKSVPIVLPDSARIM